jgi:hypothetical protein
VASAGVVPRDPPVSSGAGFEQEMNKFQVSLITVGLLLSGVFTYEWQKVKQAEAGPAKLIRDLNDHAVGGMLRADLEPYLAQRGGDLSYDLVQGDGRTSGIDHVQFRNIRHLGDSREDLLGDFYYDQGDHLVYFALRRKWQKMR